MFVTASLGMNKKIGRNESSIASRIFINKSVYKNISNLYRRIKSTQQLTEYK
jgi:hypothetical protein